MLAAVLIVFGGASLGLCWLLPYAAPAAFSAIDSDLLILMLIFGWAIICALVVIILFARASSKGVIYVHVDPVGIHRESRAGSWVMGSGLLPWSQVKWVRLERDNRLGRIGYGTSMGAMYLGSSLDEEAAVTLVAQMEDWRRRA